MEKKRGGKIASFWKRVLAYIIDVLIVDVAVVYPFEKYFGKMSGFSFNLSGNLLVAVVIIAILTVFYWAILEYSMRQSIGKMIVGIYVNTTKKFTFWQFIVRNIPKISSLTIILDSLYMLMTKQHQRYFEKLSNTEVLEVPKK